MEFAFLTDVDVERASISWDAELPKSDELCRAAAAAGFTEWEIQESPIGTLTEPFRFTNEWAFPAGARALIGMNGSTLIEISD